MFEIEKKNEVMIGSECGPRFFEKCPAEGLPNPSRLGKDPVCIGFPFPHVRPSERSAIEWGVNQITISNILREIFNTSSLIFGQ